MAVWTGVINQYVSLEITYTEGSIDTTTNTSIVTLSAKLKSTSTGSWDAYNNTFEAKINNVLKHSDSNFRYDFRNGIYEIYIGTWTQKITHNADGSASVPIYVKATMVDDADPTLNTIFTLTTIPRATTPTAPYAATIGDTITIGTPRASTLFTHRLLYKFGSDVNWVLFAAGVGTSFNWTIPNIASKLPNASNAPLQIRCETYKDAEFIGAKEISTTQLYIPASYLPTASTPTYTGINTLGGNYIQGKSSATFTGGGTGSNGSTIKTSTITLKVGSQIIGSGGSPYTSGIFINVGTVSIINTVVDSRGRTATETAALGVLAYSPPKILEFTAQRCLVDGTPSTTGEYLKLTGKSSILPLNNANTKYTQLRYREMGAATWMSAGVDNTNYNGVVNSPYYSAPPNKRYEVQFVVQDAYSTTYSNLNIPTVSVAISIANSERGIAVGKPFNESDPANLQVNGSISVVDGGLIAYGIDASIREIGTNTNGTYIKYSEGTMICYRRKVMSLATTTARGTAFYGISSLERWTYPATFVGTPPIVTVNVGTGANPTRYHSASLSNNDQLTYVDMNILSLTNETLANTPLNTVAIGRWK